MRIITLVIFILISLNFTSCSTSNLRKKMFQTRDLAVDSKKSDSKQMLKTNLGSVSFSGLKL
ncbi:MAG: hypothetical protein ACI9QD_000469 [Thermoproteota archaeon]|jgi:hypothetical protein